MPRLICVMRVQSTSARKLLNTGVEHSREKAVLEPLMKITYRPKLSFDPTFFDAVLKLLENIERVVIFRHGFKGRLGSQHPALDRQVNALKALRIQEARGISKNQP